VLVMETRKRVLGAEHPDSLTSMGNLASTYWDPGPVGRGRGASCAMKMGRQVPAEEQPDS